MQFDVAGQIVRRVRWFFAFDLADELPYITPFCSANYGKIAGGTNGPGEVWSAKRVYDKGTRPRFLDGGTGPCGPGEWWTDGVPSDAPPIRLVDGYPVCCGTPGYDGQLGAKAGLSAFHPCGVDADCRLATSLVCPLGTFFFPPTGFCSYGGDIIRDARGFFQFSVFHQNGCTGCLQALWQGNFTPFDQQWEAPLAGYWQGDHSQLVYVYPPDRPLYGGTLWIVRFSVPPQRGKIGAKVGVKGQTRRVIERVELGAKAGLVSFVHTTELATVGAAAGLSGTAHGLLEGALGAKAGLESAFAAIVSAMLGAEAGVVSRLEVFETGSVGAEAGLASVLVARLGGDLGGKAGLAGSVKGRFAGTVGVKAGLSSLERVRQLATIGSKAGLAGQPIEHRVGTVGAKAGLESTQHAGHQQSCCPGTAVPISLTATVNGGTAFTMTYSSGSNSWGGINPDDSQAYTLGCVNVSGSFVWQFSVSPTIHCTQVRSATVLTCFPFSITQTLTVTGGTCGNPGVFHMAAHA